MCMEVLLLQHTNCVAHLPSKSTELKKFYYIEMFSYLVQAVKSNRFFGQNDSNLSQVQYINIVARHSKEYFGLQHSGKCGEQLWLNTRNPIKEQLGKGTHTLFFKVKIFIEPHKIIQLSTRLVHRRGCKLNEVLGTELLSAL